MSYLGALKVWLGTGWQACATMVIVGWYGLRADCSRHCCCLRAFRPQVQLYPEGSKEQPLQQIEASRRRLSFQELVALQLRLLLQRQLFRWVWVGTVEGAGLKLRLQ